ncbi:transmembrane protein 161B-like [Babylonia areolata]|uniref:transmembrane protein 161B-like n=1 Tax=Babylonia areolata TaxID=304850 RepID=UPI003FD2A40F
MAVLGAQFVFTIAMFSFLQKLSPFYSFGRWLLSNRLVRYLHPSDEELKQLAGISKGGEKGKGRRQDYKKMMTNPKEESFQVPRNLPLQLDTAKVESLDLVPLQYYTEYQWLMDFSLSTVIVYILTEVYYVIGQHHIEFNASVLWCLLSIAFCFRVLMSQTSVYLRTEEGGEKVLLFTFGFFFLVLGMGILVVGDGVLEFGLEEGYRNFSDGAMEFLKKQGVESHGPVSFMTFRILLIGFCAITGALLTFPGLRLAKLHLDSLKYHKENFVLQVLLHINYMLPVVIILLWVKPIGRDFLCGGGAFWGNQYLFHNQFDALRLLVVVGTCVARILFMPLFMQSHLNMAHEKVERMKKESGRIGSLELQKMVARVFYYLCMVAIQYLAPVLLLLFLTFLLKTLGNYSWSVVLGDSVAELFSGYQKASNRTVPAPAGNGTAASILETAAHFAVTLGDLRAVFTPVWYRGLFSFLLWWVCAAWFTTTSLGVMYYSNNLDR